MLYARIKGDLFLEELLYNKLIDLFRNPEQIKDITGNIVNPYLLEQIKYLKLK